MIETLYSLKFVLLFFLAILALDELFLGVQTAETANFFAARAFLVHRDAALTDRFFNQNVVSGFIFTKKNPFFELHNLKTSIHPSSNRLITRLAIARRFGSDQISRSLSYEAFVEIVVKP